LIVAKVNSLQLGELVAVLNQRLQPCICYLIAFKVNLFTLTENEISLNQFLEFSFIVSFDFFSSIMYEWN
jgi:hypothetical protein